MKTAFIIPYDADVSGVIDCYVRGNALVVNYSICFKNTVGVVRIFGLSSRKPCNKPLKIHVPVFEGSTAAGKKEVDEAAIAYYGYCPEDIDTFVLTLANNKQIAGAGFASLSWNVVKAMKEAAHEHIEKIEDIAERIKEAPLTENAYKNVTVGIDEFCQKLIVADVSPVDGYNWYKNPKNVYPLELSAYKHITDTDEFYKAHQNSRQYLFGIKDICHTALALECEGNNPFVTAADCAVYTNGFWVVGVWLGKDGQYFERVEQK